VTAYPARVRVVEDDANVRTLRELRRLAPHQRDAIVERILAADPLLRPVLPQLLAPGRNARHREQRKRPLNPRWPHYWSDLNMASPRAGSLGEVPSHF
jgi:hypothetical protein